MRILPCLRWRTFQFRLSAYRKLKSSCLLRSNCTRTSYTLDLFSTATHSKLSLGAIYTYRKTLECWSLHTSIHSRDQENERLTLNVNVAVNLLLCRLTFWSTAAHSKYFMHAARAWIPFPGDCYSRKPDQSCSEDGSSSPSQQQEAKFSWGFWTQCGWAALLQINLPLLWATLFSHLQLNAQQQKQQQQQQQHYCCKQGDEKKETKKGITLALHLLYNLDVTAETVNIGKM